MERLTRIGRIAARWTAVTGAAALLSGCAVAIMLSMEPDQRAAMFLVPADRAVIYVYHDENITPELARVIYVDGEALGTPTAGGFWYREVMPGKHTVAFADSMDAPLVIDAQAAGAYFIGEDVECAPGPKTFLHTANASAGRTRVRALVAASKSQSSETRATQAACGPATTDRSV